MSPHQAPNTGRGITWTLLCALVFGASLLLAPTSADAKLPKRKPSTDPILQFITVDNEGPVARMPIAFARRTAHQRHAVAPDAAFDRVKTSTVFGPSKPTSKTAPRPKPLMGPFPRR